MSENKHKSKRTSKLASHPQREAAEPHLADRVAGPPPGVEDNDAAVPPPSNSELSAAAPAPTDSAARRSPAAEPQTSVDADENADVGADDHAGTDADIEVNTAMITEFGTDADPDDDAADAASFTGDLSAAPKTVTDPFEPPYTCLPWIDDQGILNTGPRPTTSPDDDPELTAAIKATGIYSPRDALKKARGDNENLERERIAARVDARVKRYTLLLEYSRKLTFPRRCETVMRCFSQLQSRPSLAEGHDPRLSESTNILFMTAPLAYRTVLSVQMGSDWIAWLSARGGHESQITKHLAIIRPALHETWGVRGFSDAIQADAALAALREYLLLSGQAKSAAQRASDHQLSVLATAAISPRPKLGKFTEPVLVNAKVVDKAGVQLKLFTTIVQSLCDARQPKLIDEHLQAHPAPVSDAATASGTEVAHADETTSATLIPWQLLSAPTRLARHHCLALSVAELRGNGMLTGKGPARTLTWTEQDCSQAARPSVEIKTELPAGGSLRVVLLARIKSSRADSFKVYRQPLGLLPPRGRGDVEIACPKCSEGTDAVYAAPGTASFVCASCLGARRT